MPWIIWQISAQLIGVATGALFSAATSWLGPIGFLIGYSIANAIHSYYEEQKNLQIIASQTFHNNDYEGDITLSDKKAFDKLSDINQDLLLSITEKNLRRLLIDSREDNRKAYSQLLEEGLITTPSTPEQRKEMEDIGRRVHQRLSDDLYSPELLENLYRYISEYRTIDTQNKIKEDID